MKKYIIFSLMLVAFIMLPQKSNAQLDCAQEAGCTVILSNQTRTMTLRDPDCNVIVTYDVLDCGGVRAIQIKSYTVEGSCQAMTDFSIYHYNLSSLNEYISLALIEYDADDNGGVPDCSQGSRTFIKVYTASCGIWVGCEYEVDPATRDCDMGYEPPYPDYGTSPTKVKVYKWQSCGEVCCVNTYTICKIPSTISPGTYINSMMKVSSVPSGTCTLQSNYATQCQTGCM